MSNIVNLYLIDNNQNKLFEIFNIGDIGRVNDSVFNPDTKKFYIRMYGFNPDHTGSCPDIGSRCELSTYIWNSKVKEFTLQSSFLKKA